MTLRSDSLAALAAFESAARHQNFAHAAEEMHLTASAVSHHVRKLEARLGVSLFQRHARGVSLTAEGRQLADAAGSALSDMEGVLRSLHGAREEQDLVRVTTLHSLTYTWLLPRLPAFAREHPQIRLSLDTEVALTRFEEGGPDFGIRHGPGHWPGLSATLLMDDALYPVAAPTLAGIDKVRTAQDVAGLRLLSDLSRQGWQDWFRAAAVHGVTVREQYRLTDSTAALQAAVFGLGATLARERIVRPYLDAGQLQRLPGPALKTRWSYYVVHPSHKRLRPVAQTFVDWLLDEGRKSLPLT